MQRVLSRHMLQKWQLPIVHGMLPYLQERLRLRYQSWQVLCGDQSEPLNDGEYRTRLDRGLNQHGLRLVARLVLH